MFFENQTEMPHDVSGLVKPVIIRTTLLEIPHMGISGRLNIQTESLILAQNERWRRGLGMQVVRERWNFERLASQSET